MESQNKNAAIWEEIVRSFSDNPREVQSQPITKRDAVWFSVYVEDKKLFVDRAKVHKPSSNLSQRRSLSAEADKCNIMYDLYCRRKNGASVSAEATATTVNQIYWYGIFAAMGY